MTKISRGWEVGVLLAVGLACVWGAQRLRIEETPLESVSEVERDDR